MQLKYSLKKEWKHFTRTFRLGGIIITAFAVVLANLLMFKFTGAILENLEQSQNVAISTANFSGDDILGGLNLGDMASMYYDAGLMYAATLSSMISTVMLVIMLVLCSAAGGEQKKRAMIVPLCSGLNSKSYVLAKFILYPVSTFIIIFLASLFCGVLCNAFFPDNQISFGIILLASALAGIYMVFTISIFLSLGLCTSRPGVMTAVIYIGTTIIQTITQGLDRFDYNPFTLLELISGEMLVDPDFSLSDNAASIAVGTAISLLVSVLMCLLAIAVLNAKKIDNKEEKKPEF